MLPIEATESKITSLLGQLNNQQNNNKSDVKFSDTMSELISDVNSLQIEALDSTEAFVKGEPIDIHDVMIASQKAKTSFELLMELRNKALELYREVNRMQV